jgi:DNA recombination protein RmuC
MTAIWLLLGFALGVGLAAGLMRTWTLARMNGVTTEKDEALGRVRASDAAAGQQRERAEAAEREVNQLKLAAATTAGDHGRHVERLTIELANARNEGEEKLKLVTEAQETMRAVLKDAAGEAFDDSGKKVVELANAALRTATAENRETFERERKNVERLVSPMQEGLARLGEAVSKLDRDRDRQHTELGEQMKAMVAGQTQVREEAALLSRALRQPHSRGQWGEFHLRRVAEMSGMSAFCDFDEQPHTDDDGKTLRPDMLVKLPGGKQVVVDSKAPLNPYLDACEATDPAVRERHMKLYARGLRAHIKKLSAKNYSAQFDDAPDFVVMYLPGEHFFTEAVAIERSLIDDAVSDRVLIATPMTFIVLLRTIAYAWQQEKVAQAARDIAHLGCTLYERLCTYLQHVEKESRLLNSLVEAHNKGVGSLERWVLPAARRFPEMGAVGVDKQLPAGKTVTSSAREVQAPELTGSLQNAEMPANSGEERLSELANLPAGEEAA